MPFCVGWGERLAVKECILTIIQIIDTFTFYGLDIIALAAATCVCVQIIKLTLLKKCRRKIATFLPVVLGTLFYAVYAGVCHLSFKWVLDNYVGVLEHGFSVGALSTLIYVLYEQFIREKETTGATQSVIATLIEGYVPDDKTEQAAKAICEALERDVTGNGTKRVAEILDENRPEDVSEADVKLLAKLIIETIAHINANA